VSEHIVTCPDGFRFIQRGPSTDDHLALGMHESGLEPTLYGFAEACAADAQIVVVGAHVGLWAVRLAQFRPVVAYEANPATADTLRRNVNLNREQLKHHVQVREFAVWSVSGEYVALMDANEKDEGGSTRVVDGLASLAGIGKDFPGRHYGICTAALDDDRLNNVGLIVIDVEGAEARVLRGARNILKRDRPTMVIEVHEGHPGTDPDLRDQLDHELRRADYDWVAVDITGERYLARHKSLMPVLDFEPEEIQLGGEG
jgi:FkbM family methyltransferase